jgi:hypothetical protein
MELPIEEYRPLAKKIELALAYALHIREVYGQRLEQVILPPEMGREYLGVSSLATPPCALYYQLTNTEKEATDAGSRFGFDTGHILESYVLDLLHCSDRQGEMVWPYLLAPGGVIKGHYDGRLPVGLMDGSCIIESKATGGYSFGMKKEEGADQGHVEQAFAYASRTGSPYFVIIYSNREAKKSTPFYQVFAYRITNMAAAARTVLDLFAERFDPVLLSLHHEARPDAPMAPRHEFGARGWRCRPDKSYHARGGKLQQQVGYCSYRGICPEALLYAGIEEERLQAVA